MAGIEFGECYDVLPVVSHEFETYDLLSARGNQFYGANGNGKIGDDV